MTPRLTISLVDNGNGMEWRAVNAAGETEMSMPAFGARKPLRVQRRKARPSY